MLREEISFRKNSGSILLTGSVACLLVIFAGCSKSKTGNDLQLFLARGYTYNDPWVEKAVGDTSFLATINSEYQIKSKEISFPCDTAGVRDFLRSKGFIILSRLDSLDQTFAYSNKTGNLYAIHLTKRYIYLRQKNHNFLISDFE